MNTRYVVIVVLMIMVIGSWWMLQPGPDSNQQNSTDTFNSGYYLLDADISDTDENGQMIYSLHAQRIEHNPLDDSVSLQQLNMTYASSESRPWTINATEGWMDSLHEELILEGQVNVTGSLNQSGQETIIATTRLTLDMTQNVAHTEEIVTIKMAGGSLQAVGLHANLNSQKIDLLSNVRGTFSPGDR